VQILRDHPSVAVSVTALAVGSITFLYVWGAMREAGHQGRSPAAVAVALVGAGFGIFFLGHVVFFDTQNADYSPTGISNRVAIAATLALGWVGALVAIVAPITRGRLRNAAFAGGVAAAAGVSVLIVDRSASSGWRPTGRSSTSLTRSAAPFHTCRARRP
jgi:hypothetical protein